jgi:hypothetical protein
MGTQLYLPAGWARRLESRLDPVERLATWTEGGLLRAVSYQGQREEKPARHVVRLIPHPNATAQPAVDLDAQQAIRDESALKSNLLRGTTFLSLNAAAGNSPVQRFLLGPSRCPRCGRAGLFNWRAVEVENAVASIPRPATDRRKQIEGS